MPETFRDEVPAELFEAYRERHPQITEKTLVTYVPHGMYAAEYLVHADIKPTPNVGDIPPSIPLKTKEVAFEKYADQNWNAYFLAYAPEVDTVFMKAPRP